MNGVISTSFLADLPLKKKKAKTPIKDKDINSGLRDAIVLDDERSNSQKPPQNANKEHQLSTFRDRAHSIANERQNATANNFKKEQSSWDEHQKPVSSSQHIEKSKDEHVRMSQNKIPESREDKIKLLKELMAKRDQRIRESQNLKETTQEQPVQQQQNINELKHQKSDPLLEELNKIMPDKKPVIQPSQSQKIIQPLQINEKKLEAPSHNNVSQINNPHILSVPQSQNLQQNKTEPKDPQKSSEEQWPDQKPLTLLDKKPYIPLPPAPKIDIQKKPKQVIEEKKPVQSAEEQKSPLQKTLDNPIFKDSSLFLQNIRQFTDEEKRIMFLADKEARAKKVQEGVSKPDVDKIDIEAALSALKAKALLPQANATTANLLQRYIAPPAAQNSQNQPQTAKVTESNKISEDAISNPQSLNPQEQQKLKINKLETPSTNQESLVNNHQPNKVSPKPQLASQASLAQNAWPSELPIAPSFIIAPPQFDEHGFTETAKRETQRPGDNDPLPYMKNSSPRWQDNSPKSAKHSLLRMETNANPFKQQFGESQRLSHQTSMPRQPSLSKQTSMPRQTSLQRQGTMGSPKQMPNAMIPNLKKKPAESTSNFPKDASNNLSYSKLLYTINKTHPRQQIMDENGETQYVKHSIWKTETGWPLCCTGTRKSDLAEYGVGVVLYFQFLKFLMLVYLVLGLISMPAFIFYSSGNAYDTKTGVELRSFLAMFTLGNIGQASSACNSASMQNATLGSSKIGSINLFCTFGTLSEVLEFGQTLAYQNTTCDGGDFVFTPKTCSYSEDMPQLAIDAVDDAFQRNCVDKVNCTFPINTTMISGNCTKGYKQKDIVFFMQASCKLDYIDVFNWKLLYLRKGNVGITVVVFDVLIVLGMFAAIHYLFKYQTVLQKEIDAAEITASDFTVEIRSLPPQDPGQQILFKAALWEWIEKHMEQYGCGQINPETGLEDPNQNNLMGLTFGQSDYGRMAFLIEMVALLKKEKTIQQSIKTYPAKKYEMQDMQLTINNQRYDIIRRLQEYDQQNEAKQTAVVAFAQFQSMLGQKKFLKAARVSSWNRWFEPDYHQHKKFMGQWLDIMKAPEPEVILWHNYNVSLKSRRLRSLLMQLMTIFLLILSMLAIFIAQYVSDQATKGFDTSVCGSAQISMEVAYEDYQLEKSKQIGLLGCYCLSQVKAIQFAAGDIVFPNGKKLCYDWIKGYSMSTAMAIMTALMVNLLNTIINAAIAWSAEYQRFLNKTDEKASSISKMFVFQLINTALMIILVNAKNPFFRMPENFPILNGKYDDFTVMWYKQVGTTLIFTMLTNIVVPRIAFTLSLLKPAFIRWMDRGYKSDMRVTQQVLQEDYEELYTGPEFAIEIRYSSLICYFYITMLFSAGIPFLYFVSLLEVFVQFWYDKWQLLRVYRTPPRYGVEFNQKARELLQYGVLLHLPAAFLMFSYTRIFSDSDNLTLVSDSIKQKAATILESMFVTLDRVQQPHSKFYLASFIIITFFFVVLKVLFALSELLAQTCKDSPIKKHFDRLFKRKAKIDSQVAADMSLNNSILQVGDSSNAPAFSNNIYKEMAIDDLKSEYQRTKTEKYFLRAEIKRGQMDQEKVQHWLAKLDLKTRTIKELLNGWLQQERIRTIQDTADAFDQLFEVRPKRRMRSLYSYDIRDNETFKSTFLVEQKMLRFLEEKEKREQEELQKQKDIENLVPYGEEGPPMLHNDNIKVEDIPPEADINFSPMENLIDDSRIIMQHSNDHEKAHLL